jgi:hypothetical protein
MSCRDKIPYGESKKMAEYANACHRFFQHRYIFEIKLGVNANECKGEGVRH